MRDLGQKRCEVRQRLIEENEFPHIPEDWGVERLRFLFTESKERNGKSPVGEMLSVSEYRGVVPREYENEEQKRTDDELENYRVVRPGQLAVNSMWLNHLGLGVSEHTGHVSPAYNVYDISDRLDRRFVHHLMRSNYYLKIYLRYLYGIRPNSFQIKSNDWASIPIIVPDLATQRQIAEFLDRETARIDLLIEKKQRLVALLGEREAALRDRLLQISTDDAVEDLERPWLSGYCGDWNVQRLSYYLRSSPCYGVLKPDNYEGADAVPIIRIKDISDGELQLDDIVTISPQQSQEYSRTILRIGDVVLSVVGTIGKILTVDEIAAGMNLTRALARVQLSEGLSADFLKLVVGSRWFTEYVTVTTQGSAQKVLNMDDLRAWRFPVPPKAEQTRVCEMYREQSASLVATRQKTNTSIDRLKEYRSALITAAVTGQIGVSSTAKSGTPDSALYAIQEEMGA